MSFATIALTTSDPFPAALEPDPGWPAEESDGALDACVDEMAEAAAEGVGRSLALAAREIWDLEETLDQIVSFLFLHGSGRRRANLILGAVQLLLVLLGVVRWSR